MYFKSKLSKSSIFGLCFFSLLITYLAFILWIKYPEKIVSNSLLSIGLICFAGFFLSLFNTFYEINSPHLNYKSGPHKGEILIESINRIEVVQSIWNLKYILNLSTSYAPALGNSGLWLFYEQNKEIYISPEDVEVCLKELLKFNPTIDVKR